MEIQLQEYFQQTLPKHNIIDQRLTPLLSRVRKGNINSIHQLQKELKIEPTLNQKGPQHLRTKEIFGYQPKKTTIHNESIVKANQTARARFYSTIQSRPKRLSKTSHIRNPEERKIMINPLSKVRRHLVDYIDFKELQKAMYQKEQKINVYENFCNNIKERSQSLSEKKGFLHYRQPSKDERKSEPELQNFTQEESGFRITNRKKFWRKGNSYRLKSTEGHECLRVKGFFNTLS